MSCNKYKIISVKPTPNIKSNGTQEAVLTLFAPAPKEVSVKISVGADDAYIASLGTVPAGESSVVIPVTDTHESLKANETTTLKISLLDGEEAVAEFVDNEWKKTRHWEFFLSQQMHTDLGYTAYQEELKNRFSGYLDTVNEYIKNSVARDEDKQKYHYNIESSYQLGECFMARRNADQIGETVDNIKKGYISVCGGQFNFTMENFTTEETARAAYYTNRYLKDKIGIKTGSVENMFDNPAFSKSYVDVAVEAGIKYGVHSMNPDRSPYFKLRQYDLFYMQGNNPENKLLIFNGKAYSENYGLGGSHFDRTGTPELADKVFRELMEHLESKTGRNAYPYDLFPMTLVPFGDNLQPLEDQIINANALNKKWSDSGYIYPRITTCGVDEFFKAAEERYGEIIPVETGTEENWWNDGWGTTAYESGINKISGNTIPVGETLSSFAALFENAAYPYELINEAVERNLIYDEHTWGAAGYDGSWQYRNQFEWKRSNAFAAKALGEKILNSSIKSLSGGIKVGEQSIYVYNPLNWARNDVVTVEDISALPEFFEITDGEKSVPYTINDGKLEFIADAVPPIGYKIFTIKASSSKPSFAQQIEVDGNTVSNQFFKISFDADGTICSLKDLMNGGREMIDTTNDEKFNQYRYYDDFGIPFSNEGADFSAKNWKMHTPDDAKLKIEQSPVGACVYSDATAFRADFIKQKVTIYNNIPRIDIENTVVKSALPGLHLKEEAFYTFPFKAEKNYEIRFDLPIGNAAEGEQIKGTSTDWYSVNKWISVIDKSAGYNMVLATPNTVLAQFGERRTGAWSFDYKSSKPCIYSYIFNNMWQTNFQGDQPGLVSFKYSVSANTSSDITETAKFGWEVSYPFRAAVIGASSGEPSAKSDCYIKISNPNVIMTTAKTAEANGKGMILRFHEISGKQAKCVKVQLPIAAEGIFKTDVIENDIEKMTSGDSFEFDIKPYGINTYRVVFGNAPARVSGLSAVTGDKCGTLISWENADGAAYYEIFRSDDESFAAGSGNYLVSTCRNEFLDKQVNVEVKNKYYYRVRAVASGEKGEFTDSVPARRGNLDYTVKPEIPELFGEVRRGRRIDLYWTEAYARYGVDHYDIYRDGEKIGQTNDGYIVCYRDETLEPDRRYSYKIKSVDACGNESDFSDEITLTTFDTATASLKNLRLTGGVLSVHFDAETLNYTLNTNCGDNETAVSLIAEPLHDDAIITINGVVVSSGKASDKLTVKSGDRIKIKVDETGKSKVYTLFVSGNEAVIPAVDATAGSEFNKINGAQTPVHIIDGSGMTGRGTVDDTHDNNGSAFTMWHTLENPGKDAWVCIDLGKIYPLGKMHIWNHNQENQSSRGMKQVKIEYSTDGDSWKSLSAPNGMAADSTEYNFCFAKSDGSVSAAATNLDDGKHSPVDFGGVKARFVKITADPNPEKGTWGSNIYGLSEVRITADTKLLNIF